MPDQGDNEDTPIRAARKRAGFTSANKACRAVGIDQASYNGFETGKKLPGRENLIKIADTFKCSVDDLLGRTATDAATA